MYNVVESVRNVDICSVVCRKPLAVAGNRASRDRAARDRLAGRADRHATQLQVGDHVRNAVGAISRIPERTGPGRRPKRDHEGTGHSPVRIAHVVAQAFVSAKEKCLVLDDRSAHAAPELLQRSGQLRRWGSIEIVSCVHDSVAAKTKCSAMHVVATGLQAHIHHHSGFPSVLRRGILLQIELLNRVDGQNGCRVAGNSGAVNDCLPGVGLTIEQTFDEVGVIFRAQAVGAGGGKSATGITHDAWPKLQQVFIVAAV